MTVVAEFTYSDPYSSWLRRVFAPLGIPAMLFPDVSRRNIRKPRKLLDVLFLVYDITSGATFAL